MSLTAIANEFPILVMVMVAAFGASIGSFLNVVIYRLPIMMYKEWQAQCNELQQDPVLDHLPKEPLSLAMPGSSCPSCSHSIHPLHNLPIISFIWLKAKCKYCGTRISPRYFLVELAGAVLALFIFSLYGADPRTFFILLFTFLLLPLIFIDIEYKLLPDNITFLLLWSGVIYSLLGFGINIESSIWGIIAGYLSLWSVYIIFKLATGKEGMGYGDFKLLAALGAWVGWQQLLPVILISSLTGTVAGVTLLIISRSKGEQMTSIPFGPYLAMGGWITLLWGQDLTRWYLSTM